MVKSEKDKNIRIAKNALMLYIRMILIMVVTLYTSRLILIELGVSDFGIYYVVAGFVAMLGFVNNAMSVVTQRFLAFELGGERKKNIDNIFSMSLNIHIIVAIIFLLVGESIGLWFIRSQLLIPVDRILAAEMVFQFSLFSFIFTIISVPFNALIIAYERMAFFAWVGLVDVFLKLLIVFMLQFFDVDKLLLYGLLNFIIVVFVTFIYFFYCYNKFSNCRFKLYWNKNIFTTMLSFVGWNLWGNIALVMSNQGINILLNIFFGPTVNAARAISMQVSTALNNFVQNVQVAVNPQIIKSYASKDMIYMHNLICYSSKYNFFILLLLSLPILNNIDYIISIWLIKIPENTVVFTKIIIYIGLIDSLAPPLATAVQASGRIKIYQIVIGGILLLNIPIAYYLLASGGDPHIVFYSIMVVAVLALFSRFILINRLIGLSRKMYLKNTVYPIFFVIVLVLFLNGLVKVNMENTLFQFLISSFFSVVLVLSAVFLVGLKRHERYYILNFFNGFKKIFK